MKSKQGEAFYEIHHKTAPSTTRLDTTPVLISNTNTTALSLHPLNNLPNELLQEIFICRIHCATRVHPISPVLLLLVCRRWYYIANATPELWTNIIYWHDVLAADSDWVVGKPIKCQNAATKEAIQRAIVCHTPELLARTIARAGGLKFDLAVMDNGILKDDEESDNGAEDVGESDNSADDVDESAYWHQFDFSPIQSRCRSLDLLNIGFEPKDFFFKLSLLGGMVALENLYLRPGVYAFKRSSCIHRFLNSICTDNLNLYRFELLTTELDCYDSGSHQRWEPALMSRLKQLRLRMDEWQESLLEEDLPRLEELDIDVADIWIQLPSQLPRLRSLIIRDGDLSFISEGWYAQLTSLSLDYWMQYCIPLPESVLHLPQLESLSVAGYWSFIKYIDAPNLIKLALHRQVLPEYDPRSGSILTNPGVWYDIIGSPSIRPRILHIEKLIPERSFVRLFKKVCEELKELQITCLEDNGMGNTVGEVLLSEFRRTPTAGNDIRGKVFCPRLRKLVVLAPLPTPCSKRQQDLIMRVMVKKLEGVIQARKVTDVLEYVSCGLYPVDWSYRLYDNKELWNTDWKRIL